MTITFTRRQIALALRILMLGESLKRLATATHTSPADLRRIADDRLAPTVGLLNYLDVESKGGLFVWRVQ